ncbi:purine nucleoside permease [Pseudonocardiaceae bacterium YIM PH 21723]|nr:purine nucleoside permease [Pseudonocardiaceae bacterium YIM PH 21723]
MKRVLGLALALATLTSACGAADGAESSREVKVLVITAFDKPGHGETNRWIDRDKLTEEIAVPGLNPKFPVVRCNDRGLCAMTTGMGQANAAASVNAVLHSGRFDLSKAYILIAGLAGIDPKSGTLGSAAWARYAVDGGLASEIDAREIPADWSSGYLALGADHPDADATFSAGTELFELNKALTDRAVELSKGVELADTPQAAEARANWPEAPANAKPQVMACDTMTSNGYWGGRLFSERAHAWTARVTKGQGRYCTTQMEDNGILAALDRGRAEKLLDFQRIALVRTGSDFDQPWPGQSPVEALNEGRGYVLAAENAYRAGAALAHDVLDHWDSWRDHTP